MSVIVKNLSKKYGSQLALDNVSFSAEKGQITGFLGPNGAGKTRLKHAIVESIQSNPIMDLIIEATRKEEADPNPLFSPVKPVKPPEVVLILLKLLTVPNWANVIKGMVVTRARKRCFSFMRFK